MCLNKILLHSFNQKRVALIFSRTYVTSHVLGLTFKVCLINRKHLSVHWCLSNKSLMIYFCALHVDHGAEISWKALYAIELICLSCFANYQGFSVNHPIIVFVVLFLWMQRCVLYVLQVYAYIFTSNVYATHNISYKHLSQECMMWIVG